MLNDKEHNNTKYLLKMYEHFLTGYYLSAKDFPIDINLLQTISVRYWKDVDRLHIYHPETQKIDCHKIAGYLTFWICKIRPISVSDYNLYLKNYVTACYINEFFSLAVGIARIYSHNKADSGKFFIRPEASFVESFVYTLKYRPTSGDNLALMYYLLEKSSK